MTRPFRRFGAAAALGALTASALMNGLAPAVADTRSNTTNRLPNNLYLGDINGDGSADLQVSANKLFAFGTDCEARRSCTSTSSRTSPECATGNTCATTGNYYTVELREPRAWDRAFTRSAVLIHKVGTTNGMTQTYLETSPVTQFTAGTTYQDGNVTIRVNSIATARGVANVTITW